MLWHAAARALPVTVHPLRGETVISYARRLSEANELAPATIMRALGQLSTGGSRVHNHDAWLNAQALDRLETYSGISRHHLTRALPSLHAGPSSLRQMPAGRPALHFYRPWPPAQPACQRCTLRSSGHTTTPALIHPWASPLICRRDKRWLDPGTQYDLSEATEILASHRRYTRLLAASDDKRWFTASFSTAGQITCSWAAAPGRFPVLGQRWQDRAHRLAIPPSAPAPPVLAFPEAVTLTEILTDLNWRRHVAMVLDHDLDRFYQHVARTLGESSYPRLPASHDPLTGWAAWHRDKFAATRTNLWARTRGRPVPFPEIRHFK